MKKKLFFILLCVILILTACRSATVKPEVSQSASAKPEASASVATETAGASQTNTAGNDSSNQTQPVNKTENTLQDQLALEKVKGIVDGFAKGDLWGYQFGNTIDWSLPGVSNPDNQYNIYRMYWLRALLTDWNITHDDSYTSKAISIVLDWIDHFPQMKSSQPKMVWNGDTTARRCYTICLMADLWKDKLTADQLNKIGTSMKYHATLLASPSFYVWHQNYGLFQDSALLKYTKVFSDPKNTEYQSLVKTRVLDYANSLIFKDGVDGEHSPSYHISVAEVLNTIQEDYRDIEPQFSDQLLIDYIGKMKDYAIQITRPDGSYPPLSDSITSFIKFPTWESDPNYQYVESAGQTGTEPAELDKIFPYGNYAIFRTSWKMDGSADWVMFVAAAHGISHKHQDDLSFMVWHHGDLFTDAGSAGYDYSGDPMAIYAVQPWGHSVMVSNWDDPANKKIYAYRPEATADELKTRIINSSISGPIVSVTGVQARISGITQTRTLQWNKTSNSISIQDDVTSQAPKNKHMFLYHLADGVKPQINADQSISLYRGSHVEATIVLSSKDKMNVRLCYGDNDATVKAWNAEKRVANWIIAVEFDNASTSLSLTTRIDLQN